MSGLPVIYGPNDKPIGRPPKVFSSSAEIGSDLYGTYGDWGKNIMESLENPMM